MASYPVQVVKVFVATATATAPAAAAPAYTYPFRDSPSPRDAGVFFSFQRLEHLITRAIVRSAIEPSQHTPRSTRSMQIAWPRDMARASREKTA